MKRLTVLVCLLLVLPALRVGAQQVTMTVDVGFDQNFKLGRWVPISVELENQGGDVDGRIVTESQQISFGGAPSFGVTRFAAPFSLPSGGKKRILLYARLMRLQQRVTVVAESGRRVINQQDVTVRQAAEEDAIVLAIGSSQGGLGFLSGVKLPMPNRPSPIARPPGYGQTPNQGQVWVWYCEPNRLPDHWKGFDGVDVMAIGSVSASALSSGQQRAIRDWVEAGGTLVVSGGVDWRRLRDPFFREMLPVDATGSTQLSSLASLGGRYGSTIPVSGPFLVPSAKVLPGAGLVAAQDGVPVVAERALGLGKVVYLAPDYAQAPMTGWNQQAKFWMPYLLSAGKESVLSELRTPSQGPGYYRTPYNARAQYSLVSAVTSIPAMDAPSFGLIGLFLACYIIVLVPVNYWVLKKKDKREYAWVTIPVIVLVFSLGAYVIGYVIKGGRVLVTEATVIETRAGSSRAAALGYAGIFSPARTSYDVSYNDPRAILAEAEDTQNPSRANLTVETGDVMGVRDLAIDMWSMRVLQAESVVDLGGEISASLSSNGNFIQGKISNNTDYGLDNCSLFFAGSWHSIKNLPSGAQDVAVNVPLAPGPAGIPMPAPSPAPGPTGGPMPVPGAPIPAPGAAPGSTGAPVPVGVPIPAPSGPVRDKMTQGMSTEITRATSAKPSPGVLLFGWARKPVLTPDLHRRFVQRESVQLVIVHLAEPSGKP